MEKSTSSNNTSRWLSAYAAMGQRSLFWVNQDTAWIGTDANDQQYRKWPSKHETSNQCWSTVYDAGPTLGRCLVFAEELGHRWFIGGWSCMVDPRLYHTIPTHFYTCRHTLVTAIPDLYFHMDGSCLTRCTSYFINTVGVHNHIDQTPTCMLV